MSDNYMVTSFVILVILIGMVLVVLIDKPDKYHAQDSMNYINKCFEENNNSLECYYICRTEEWNEDYCKVMYYNRDITTPVEYIAVADYNASSPETFFDGYDSGYDYSNFTKEDYINVTRQFYANMYFMCVYLEQDNCTDWKTKHDNVSEIVNEKWSEIR